MTVTHELEAFLDGRGAIAAAERSASSRGVSEYVGGIYIIVVGLVK